MSDDGPPGGGPADRDTPADEGGSNAAGSGPSGPMGPHENRGAPTRLAPVDLYEAAKKAPGSVDIEKQREDVREYLAKRLLLLLAGTMVLGAVLMATQRWTEVSDDDIRLFFQVGFTAVIALVSAATGFYFGNATNNHRGGGGGDS